MNAKKLFEVCLTIVFLGVVIAMVVVSVQGKLAERSIQTKPDVTSWKIDRIDIDAPTATPNPVTPAEAAAPAESDAPSSDVPAGNTPSVQPAAPKPSPTPRPAPQNYEITVGPPEPVASTPKPQVSAPADIYVNTF